MNRIQRSATFVLAAALLVPAWSSAAVTLTVDTTEPATSVVIANPHTTYSTASPGPLGERDTFTTAFPSGGTNGIATRGQTFLMPDNPAGSSWDLSALTIRADANAAGSGTAQDFSSGATMRLWLFAWPAAADANDGTQWLLGNGASDGDPLDGTGVTNVLVNGQSVDVSRSFSGDFLHFSTPGVQLAENTAYALLVAFDSDTYTAGMRLDQIRDGTAPTGEAYLSGANIQSNATANTHNSNGDDLVFYVQATPSPIPEPVSATTLGIGASLMLLRRRTSPRR